jgi:hypothetical protein
MDGALAAIDCGFNRSLQHLVSIRREELVADENQCLIGLLCPPLAHQIEGQSPSTREFTLSLYSDPITLSFNLNFVRGARVNA